LNLTDAESLELSSAADELTDALSNVIFKIEKMPAVAEKDLHAECLKYFRLRASEFMVSVDELSPLSAKPTMLPNGIAVVSFTRFVGGLLLRDSVAQCVFAPVSSDTFALREVVNRTGGKVSLKNISTERANIDDARAEAGSDSLVDEGSRSVILAVPNEKSLEFVRAREFNVSDRNTAEGFTITIADGSRELLEAFPHRQNLKDIQVSAQSYKVGYVDKTVAPFPLSFATVSDNNGQTYILDPDGRAKIPDNIDELTINLLGPRGMVFDLAQTTTSPVALPFSAGTAPATIFPSNSLSFRALNTYVNLQKINRFTRRHLKSTQSALLDSDLQIAVNYTSDACNAFYDPDNKSIFLFAAGTAGTIACANMADINDVFYHEWGHGLDDSLGIAGGITDAAYSEGIGDILATYMTGNHLIGVGFRAGQPGQSIRSVVNSARYPSAVGEVHAEGQIIAGAFWDLRSNLVARYGAEAGAAHAEKLFFNHLMITDTYLDAYRTVLLIDDNDGNAETQSPNFCAINRSFAAHGLAEAKVPCTDPVEGAGIPFDETLKLGIVPSGVKDAGKLMGSAGLNTVRVQLCKGSWASCLPEGKVDFELVPAGKKGERILFLSKTTVPLAEQDLFTMVAKDEYGKVISVKTIKIVKR
jgi:hypothetical protein